MVETEFQETLKIFEIFRRRMNHFASNSVINFVPKPELRMCPVAMALLHDNAGTFFIWRCRLPATAGRAFSRCHGAAPIGIMISMMKRHGKYGKSMESCGAAWVGSSDWANHLQSQVKETMERRKERFLSAAEAAWQETNTCKYSRFESIESQFSSCFEYSGPTHCIAFTSPKDNERNSAHSKPRTIDSSIPFACHAKENLVFIRAVARLFQIPGLAFLQCI